jgi:hypothetical protein
MNLIHPLPLKLNFASESEKTRHYQINRRAKMIGFKNLEGVF